MKSHRFGYRSANAPATAGHYGYPAFQTEQWGSIHD
jgi:hypothetical protein